MRFDSVLWVNAQDASVSITSGAIYLQNLYGYSLMAIFTGNVTGTLKLQASCDPGANGDVSGSSVVNWVDIGGTSQAIAAPTKALYNLDAQYYKWVRAVYTATGGAGTMTIYFNGKGA